MEAQEKTPDLGQKNHSGLNEEKKTHDKPPNKGKTKKEERKKKAAKDKTTEEETKDVTDGVKKLSIAQQEAMINKQKHEKKTLTNIIEEHEIDEESLDKLSEDDRRGETDIRVAIIGNVDSGKSTLVGVLSKGELDDGRGAARLKVFNFTHEAQNGRTSSIGQEIMGFDENNQWIEPERVKATKNQTWGNITEHAQKLVTFIDLCGHEKYLKTTMFGMVGLLPDYCMIVIGANMGITRMTREHLVIALALRVPIFVAITKVDIAPEEIYEKTINKLKQILEGKSVKKNPILVEEEDKNLDEYARRMYDENICPIFTTSNVTGKGITELKYFMSSLRSRIYKTGKFKPPTEPVEFMIDGFYMVTGVGGVVAGTLTSGKVKKGDTLYLGPDSTGHFKEVNIRSIHYKRTSVEEVVSGQVCCFNIKPMGKKEQIKRSIFRKGMVLVGKDANPESIWEFVAEIVILHNPTTIKQNYQAVIHSGVIRQAAKIMEIGNEDKDTLMMGDKGYVHFKFMYRPEYLKEGAALMMREGRSKALGHVLKIVRPSESTKS